MKRTRMTYLICFDDHRNFSEDVRKRFSDPSRYSVKSFHSKQEFIDCCSQEKDNKSCKVAIIGVPDSREQFNMIEGLTSVVKRTDPATGIILIVPADRMEDITKVIRFNIDAYIPRNTNAILRIHNIVKKLYSEHNIKYYRRRRNISLIFLLLFLLLAAIITVIAFFKLPQYF